MFRRKSIKVSGRLEVLASMFIHAFKNVTNTFNNFAKCLTDHPHKTHNFPLYSLLRYQIEMHIALVYKNAIYIVIHRTGNIKNSHFQICSGSLYCIENVCYFSFLISHWKTIDLTVWCVLEF